MKKKTYLTPSCQDSASFVPNVLDNQSTPGLIPWEVLATRMKYDTALAQHIQSIRQYKAAMDAALNEN